MKNFIIWPILVPALAFCNDETPLTSPIERGIELDVPGTNRHETIMQHGRSTDFSDDFLSEPAPMPSVSLEGTITDMDDDDTYCGGCCTCDDYDGQDVDDSALDTDDSQMR